MNTNTTKCSNIYVYNQYMNVQIIQKYNTVEYTNNITNFNVFQNKLLTEKLPLMSHRSVTSK